MRSIRPRGKTGQGVGDGDGGDAQVRSQADAFDARPLEADAGDEEFRFHQAARGERALDDHPDERRPRRNRRAERHPAKTGDDEHRHARGPRQPALRRARCIRLLDHRQSLAVCRTLG